jgi:hypothetical protein
MVDYATIKTRQIMKVEKKGGVRIMIGMSKEKAESVGGGVSSWTVKSIERAPTSKIDIYMPTTCVSSHV